MNIRHASSEADRAPYLRNARFDELFGHLYRETSSPEFKKRFEDQVESIRQSKRGKATQYRKVNV